MRRLIIIAVFAAAAVGIFMAFVLSPGHSGKRRMGLAFVGFTNTQGRTEALFWFTNSADPHFSWHVSRMSRRDPTGWVEEPQWTNAGPSRHTPMSAAGWALPGYEDLDLVGLPVWTTNVPVRVVVEYPERERWRRRFQIWMQEQKDSARTGTKVVYSRDRRVELTGETIVK
jgi:hypothetical protein